MLYKLMMCKISTVVRCIISRMENLATDDVQNQHSRPTYNLSDGKTKRTKRIKQQRNTSGMPAKVPPMPLSVICSE